MVNGVFVMLMEALFYLLNIKRLIISIMVFTMFFGKVRTNTENTP